MHINNYILFNFVIKKKESVKIDCVINHIITLIYCAIGCVTTPVITSKDESESHCGNSEEVTKSDLSATYPLMFEKWIRMCE